MVEQKREDNIDILKSICAFWIVCIHVSFPGIFGLYYTALTRIAVPIFFMITGYFYLDISESRREVFQIKKIFILVVEANFLYLVWDVFIVLISNDSNFFRSTFNMKNFLKFVVLNESFLKGHLWYLGAILYVLLIVYVLDKNKIGKVLYYITPLLLMGDIVLGKYSVLLLGREFPYILVRNFCFVGIPYFCIGRLIRSGFVWKAKKILLTVLIITFSASTFIERFLLVSINANAVRDHYISTTFLAVAVFLFTLQCHGDNKILALIGRKYSTWLYILHPIFIDIIGTFAHKAGVYGIYKYIAPIVVYIITLIFLVLVDKIKMAFIINRRKKGIV